MDKKLTTENPTPTPQHDYTPETRRDWETVQDNGADDRTERLLITNGWLYRTVTAGAVALVFVPQ